MKDKITDRELNLIRLETIENMAGMQSIRKTGLTKRIRKAVEDDKKLKRIEAANLHKKSWQDNIWLYLVITILAGIIVYLITKSIP